MKRTTIAKTFGIAAVAALALGIAPTARADDKGCSNASLKGTFAYTMTGVLTVPGFAGPFAEVGAQTFDGRGATTATATLSQNGNIRQVTITGTYTVNPDCTGTFTLLVSPLGVTNRVFFVIHDGGTAFQSIEINPGISVITGIGRKQFPAVADWRE